MHYDARRNDHGLPHDPFKALVAPRPIGWISTVDAKGQANLAPYSYFNAICDKPHLVMFSSMGRKDTLSNIEATGAFVCNLATYALREAVNMTSAPAPHGVSEFELAGLVPAPSVAVAPPRVAQAPVALECELVRVLPLTDAAGAPARYTAAIGEVVHIHIDDAIIRDGIVDLAAAGAIARCGYRQYAHVDSLFEMKRPDYRS
ncbi:flavin reductase family protein [Acuticoccus mangrovi]|uniref:Flavin reductase family protein n=1 Tax=Acuticoccus mangrovi TaxID=2796142 RepID=A0A934MFF8_9HYPH|nr:flavin reductase family protein [Acuticoccus mangrovi]MBJ3774880.1 flavin reductase family protein [Acuticoccus mangrovi]